MTEVQMSAVAAIEKQQPKERSAVWMVGEQLKDIVIHEPECALMILEDLQSENMSIKKAEEKIAERAAKNKVGRVGCVTPAEADEILRKFYGLPDRTQAAPPAKQEEKALAGEIIDIFDFLGR